MPIDNFRTNYPDIPHRIRGATLNRQNGILNAAVNGVPIGMNGINTTGIASSSPLLTRCGPMIVTNIDDDCSDNVDEPDNNDFPCRSAKKYLGKFRHYKRGSSTVEWSLTDESEKNIDLSPWWPDGIASGPILLVGDIIIAGYDKLRGCYIPLSFPTVRTVILTAELASNSTATANVLRRSGSTWESVTGVSLTVADMSLNSADDPWPVGTKGLAVWIIDTWLFVAISCEADDTGIA